MRKLSLALLCLVAAACSEAHIDTAPRSSDEQDLPSERSEEDAAGTDVDARVTSTQDAGGKVPDSGWPDASEAPEAPATWQHVMGSCGISLRAPALVAEPRRGTDSCVGSFRGPQCEYLADLGGFSDRLEHYLDDPAYVVEYVKVHGKVARLVTSREREDGMTYFVGIHFPPPIWRTRSGNLSSTVAATIVAQCGSETSRDTARLVLQTAELPSEEWAAPLPEPTTAVCEGDDIRPIMGYRLGCSCVEGKVEVPGVCALGARANNSTGSGEMGCFVSLAGDYYWAHVAYGELVAGAGSRHSRVAHQATEFIGTVQLECERLVAMLEGGGAHPVTGEYSYRA